MEKTSGSESDKPGGTVLTREQILGASNAPVELEIPEWGGVVMIRPLTVGSRTRVMAESKGKGDAKETETLSLRAFVECVVEPEFTAEDYGALKQVNAKAMDRVVKMVLELSGIDVEAVADARKN